MEARAGVVRQLGFAAMQLTSTNEIHLTEQFLGQVSEETRDQANEAGKRYLEAIRALLNINEQIRNNQ
jgi:2'-5' RNA ligase